jgi:hypothetical protein
MTKRAATSEATPASDQGAGRVAGAAVLASLFSFLYYFKHNDLLLYGDAVAHINIARRVFDSQTPGLLQLGTVWLPLPHLLMIPFIWANAMWQNGTGGAVPSMVAYVFGCLGIFRLVRGWLASASGTRAGAAAGAWVAVLVYGANPNLLYMQTTAMTEPLYLALFIWAVVFFAEGLRGLEDDAGARRGQGVAASLTRSACCVAAAELTRYDGWFLAGAVGLAVLVMGLRSPVRDAGDRGFRRAGLVFLLGIAVVPIAWLAYNAAVYGNALEFANGPYSAKAIEARFQAPNPALHSVPLASLYFLKAAQLNLAPGNWGRFWLAAAGLGVIFSVTRRSWLTMLLLWLPVAFYALSIAYGSVPIHVYTWWPFATFNQRYGLQLLPMFAASAGLLAAYGFAWNKAGRHRGKLLTVVVALVAVSYFSVWKADPQCLLEARRNWEIRHTLDAEVQRVVSALPADSRFLMEMGEHVGVMQQAGIPLRQVINQENHRPWKRPTDPEGLWERALADPPRYVDFVIAFDGDAVDRSANKANLTALAEIHSTGQPRARIYAARVLPNQTR